jgi:hypothetical protein
MIIDYLACPHCGNPHTEGNLCNLGCRRAWTANKERAARFAKLQDLVNSKEREPGWMFKRLYENQEAR